VTDAITAHRSAVDNVNYPAALDSAPPVRIAPIMTDLIDRIGQTPKQLTIIAANNHRFTDQKPELHKQVLAGLAWIARA
jgi:hypothetical protein